MERCVALERYMEDGRVIVDTDVILLFALVMLSFCITCQVVHQKHLTKKRSPKGPIQVRDNQVACIHILDDPTSNEYLHRYHSS